jgi:hypothetical protein
VLGGGNSDTKTLLTSYGINNLPLVKKCNTRKQKTQCFFMGERELRGMGLSKGVTRFFKTGEVLRSSSVLRENEK